MNSNFLLSSSLLVLTLVFGLFLGASCHGQHRWDKEGSSSNKEDVEVRFLTRVRRKRGLDSHDYHIIQVERPLSNSTLQIHLARIDGLVSSDFQFVVRRVRTATDKAEIIIGSGHDDMEPAHCIYSGPVTGNAPGLQPITGQAVFSACHDHEGFTGVVSTTEGQYFLRPRSSHVNSMDTPGLEDDLHTTLTISHKLSILNEDGDYESAANCQVLQPPEEMIGPIASSGETIRVTDIHSSMSTDESFTNTMRSPEVERVRRSTDGSEDLVVELAMFADEAFITAMEKKLDTKSYKVIKNYALRLAQTMQLYYDRPSITPYIQFRVVRFEFFVKNPADLRTNHGSLEPYLDSFCKHASKRNNKGQWDHALLLTGLDLRDGTVTSPVGAAYVTGMCRTNGACSVIEGTDFKAGHIMAHEIGHSLGLEHDGSELNTNCSSSAYLMAPYLEPNQVNWSTCSNENLGAFLKQVEIPSFFRRTDCLKSSVSEKPGKHYKYSKKLPGEHYPADVQCKMHDPNHPIAVTPMMKNKVVMSQPINVCKMLLCTGPSIPYAYFRHPALEGTECDKGKWCRSGDCVTKK